MSWLRTSPLRQSFTRTSRSRSIDATTTECDPKACYDSFCKHWQQIYDIILRAEVSSIFQIIFFYEFYRNFNYFSIQIHADIKWNDQPRRCDWCCQSFGSYGHVATVGIAPLQ